MRLHLVFDDRGQDLIEYALLASLARFLRDECGQDIVEYALLAALIGTVGILAWQNIVGRIGNAYTGWDTGVQGLSSCTPNPGGGGC